MTATVLESTLTCPQCGHRSIEAMPTDACLFFWTCPGCGTRHKPKPGDCCVFCSYGSVPCPPVQVERAKGSAAQCGGCVAT
ncbi:MAG: GDCCVxC domain-containing (seleno)protein [Burkholderiales bacterium]